MNKNLVLVAGAIVFKEKGSKLSWFLIKPKDAEGWEIPKVLVRKGESSVRAVLRIMGERGGMNTKVLEEAGRAGGVTTVNGKTLSQRYLYYLMLMRSGLSEAIGFENYQWLDYSQALKKLNSKREKIMLRQAKEVLRDWKKQRGKKTTQNGDLV